MELTEREKTIAIESFTVGFKMAAMGNGPKIYDRAWDMAVEFVEEKGHILADGEEQATKDRLSKGKEEEKEQQ